MAKCDVEVFRAHGAQACIKLMHAPTDRLHQGFTMNQRTPWSETIHLSCRGKGELPARPRVTPLTDLGDRAGRLKQIQLGEQLYNRISK